MMPLARELVDTQPAAIVALGGVGVLIAAKNATSTIPILYAGGGDPVKLGLAASLNCPGGNITGITFELNAFVSKRLDLLLKLLRDVTTVGYLIGDRQIGEVDELLGAARVLGRQIIILECPRPDDIGRAFTTMAQEQVGALIVGAFPTAFNRRKMVLTLTAEHRIPAIYAQANMPVAGFIHGGFAEPWGDNAAALRKGLSQSGYVDGQNVTVEYHWLQGQWDRMPAVVADPFRRRVAVIAALGSSLSVAARAATATIPIVFGVTEHPVRLGLVDSLARPAQPLTSAKACLRHFRERCLKEALHFKGATSWSSES
jgi:ABC-type uncharacterized transport system substrate-binding protein